MNGPSLEKPDRLSGLELTVDNADRGHDPPVLVELTVENQRPKRRIWVAIGSRGSLDDRIQQVRYTLTGFGADPEDLTGGNPQALLDLLGVAVRFGGRKVDLVEDGHDLEIVLEGLVAVGQGLGLDALGGVHDEDYPLAGRQGPAHLVTKIDVTRRVDQVHHRVPPVEAHALEFDGDTPLPLQVHGVQVLGPHVPGIDRPAQLEHPVSQGGLSVVDVSDD